MTGRMTATSEPFSATYEDGCRFFLPVKPTPASRPRFSKRGHTYYGKRYKAWIKEAETEVAEWPSEYFTGPVSVWLVNYIVRPKTTKRSYPTGDVDNYAKAQLDVLTRASHVWHDDDQVVSLTVTKEFVDCQEDEGTMVYIYPVIGMEE